MRRKVPATVELTGCSTFLKSRTSLAALEKSSGAFSAARIDPFIALRQFRTIKNKPPSLKDGICITQCKVSRFVQFASTDFSAIFSQLKSNGGIYGVFTPLQLKSAAVKLNHNEYKYLTVKIKSNFQNDTSPKITAA